MSGGCINLTFPHNSSSNGASRGVSHTKSHFSFGKIINSYRVCSHVAFHVNLVHSIKRREKDTRIQSSILPDGSPPLIPLPSGSGQWKTWVVGTVVAVLLSFVKSKWAPLLNLKDEFQVVVKTADRVAEVVEKVANEVEKVADAVADHTPVNSKVHTAAVLVEKVAKEIAKDAHVVDVALDKVEEVEQEVERDVESLFMRPIIIDQPSTTPKDPDA